MGRLPSTEHEGAIWIKGNYRPDVITPEELVESDYGRFQELRHRPERFVLIKDESVLPEVCQALIDHPDIDVFGAVELVTGEVVKGS